MASLFDGFKTNPVQIVFKTGLSAGEEKIFALDVVKAIRTNLSASITKFPIEGGGNISDHVQLEPLTISLEGLISESPSNQFLTIASSIASFAAGTVGQFQGLSSTFASAAASAAVVGATGFFGAGADKKKAKYIPLLTDRKAVDPDFPKTAMKGIIQMFEAGESFTIRTFFTKDIYRNMVMKSLSFDQSSTTGNSLPFSMTCERVVLIEKFSITPSETRMADPAGSSAAETAEQGSKTKKEVDSRLFTRNVLPTL